VIHVVAIALDPQGRSNAGKYRPLEPEHVVGASNGAHRAEIFTAQ